MKKTIATLAAAASVGLFAGALTLITPTSAEARGVCYAATTSINMNADIAGGATLGEAWEWAVEDGTASDTKRCWTRVSGHARTVHLVVPHLWNAIVSR